MKEALKLYPIPMTQEEHNYYISYGKPRGWSYAETMRITARAFIMLDRCEASSIKGALANASLKEKEGRKCI